jgi:hypothetical protein
MAVLIWVEVLMSPSMALFYVWGLLPRIECQPYRKIDLEGSL